MNLGPEKAAVFLDLVCIQSVLYMVKFQLSFVNSATNCVHRRWFLEPMQWWQNSVCFWCSVVCRPEDHHIQYWILDFLVPCYRDFFWFSKSLMLWTVDNEIAGMLLLYTIKLLKCCRLTSFIVRCSTRCFHYFSSLLLPSFFAMCCWH